MPFGQLLQGSSGRVLWQLGGARSSFTLGSGAETAWQHDARMHADGTVTLFDNGSNPRVHYQSRALRLELDLVRFMQDVDRRFAVRG